MTISIRSAVVGRMAPFMRAASSIAVTLAAFAVSVACRRPAPSNDPAPIASGAASASASISASASEGPSGQADDEVKPVYPMDAGVIPASIGKLCNAFFAVPEARRAACCGVAPTFTFEKECERDFGAAVNGGALVADEAAIDRCVGAMTAAHDGCAWVGRNWPDVPPACSGLFTGTIKSGARCRSSLECDKGLHCFGVGPTTPGRCGPARKAGEACDESVDALLAFTRQRDAGADHRVCAGVCTGRRCADPIAEGGACTGSAQCADGLACVHGLCKPGRGSKVGDGCATGRCEGGLRCVGATCVEPKADGAACTDDRECLGGCVKSGDAGTGRCAMRCDVR